MLVHLVRHGPPVIDPELPASSWLLDPGQLAEVDRLGEAGVLPGSGALWFASTEPKAASTAERLHPIGAVTAMDALREAGRPEGLFAREEFVATVARSLEEPDVSARDGWETTASVRARIVDALQGNILRQCKEKGAADVVMVGHGTAWTVLVAALTGEPPDLVAWRAMAMPDHITLELVAEPRSDVAAADPLTGRVVRPWGSWRWS